MSLLRHARIVGGGPGLHAIEIRDGVLASVRPDGDERCDGETVDLDGRWLMPGLWDNHVHFSQWSIARSRLDLSGALSAAHAASIVGAQITSADDLVVGVGYRDALWPDQLTASVLDERSGDVPVVLISGDLHAVWLNTAALVRFGHAGQSTGWLREQDAFDVQSAVADLADERVDALAADAARAAAARGVVGVVDFDWPDIGATWQRRIAAGTNSVRIVCSVWPARLDAAIERGPRTGDALDGTGGLATMGPLKVIIDGSLNTRTAYCYDPYPDQGGHGLLTVAADDLVELLRTARAAGLDAAVHAIGDHANTIALDAFEQSGARGRIEHAQLMTADDIARMAALGLTASVQPEHALDDRDVADRYWAGRTGRAFPYRSLLDAGVSIVLGSDAPVAPLDPWIAIAAAVHRTRDDRAAWHGEQQIPVEVALAASVGGQLQSGAPADLAVLERDPLASAAGELRAMPVAATMLGGRWTHDTLT